MKSVDRQKMCSNCDGRVPFETVVCPYCSADLSKASEVDAPKGDPLSRHQAIQDSLTSLYTPPYKGKKTEAPKISPKEPRIVAPAHHGGTAIAPGALPRDEEEEKVGKNVLLSIVALSLGSVLFILGLLQIFFSSEGMLRLEWSTKHWFIYTLAALPMLYFGYRKAEQ
ncbi:MAG: hypothetical protein KGZ30_00115 [Anaplasmataceae bacterium]|nr:hypothetical protein [Anaplasmataceae bacterium]